MISGLPGKMASGVANEISRNRNYNVFPYSLKSGKNTTEEYSGIIKLLPKNQMYDILNITCPDIIVDYTTPEVALENARFFDSYGINYVMGTTGIDIIERTQEQRNSISVIAPNMSIQIVKKNRKIKEFVKNYSNPQNLDIEIVESHQKNKKDISGTARHMKEHFRSLGIENISIESIRDIDDQLKRGVPREHLSQHAWHKFTFKNRKTGEIKIEEYKINGKDEYIEGTLRCIDFLWNKSDEYPKGTILSMEDVINGM